MRIELDIKNKRLVIDFDETRTGSADIENLLQHLRTRFAFLKTEIIPTEGERNNDTKTNHPRANTKQKK